MCAFVPLSLYHFDTETNMLVQTPFLRYMNKAGEDLFLSGTVTRPARVRVKGVQI